MSKQDDEIIQLVKRILTLSDVADQDQELAKWQLVKIHDVAKVLVPKLEKKRLVKL